MFVQGMSCQLDCESLEGRTVCVLPLRVPAPGTAQITEASVPNPTREQLPLGHSRLPAMLSALPPAVSQPALGT